MPAESRSAVAAGAVLCVLLVVPSFLLPPSGGPVSAAEVQGLRPPLRPGEIAPDFTLRDIDGGTFTFRAGHGKPSLVVFWSLFCPMCREAMPGIGRFQQRYSDIFRIVAVNLDGKRFSNALRSWAKEERPRFKVVLDELRGDLFAASDPYGVGKTPTIFLLDGEGVVRKTWAGVDARRFDAEAGAAASSLRVDTHARR